MDRQGPLPPPPSYEEAQKFQIDGPRGTPDEDNDETPPSMPLLGATGGSDAPGPQNQNLGQMGVFPQSTVAVSASTGSTSFTNVTSGTTVDVSSLMGTTNTPTSIPIPPGHVPIITCHSCGARQQIGQYSFLPKTQVINMQANVGSMNIYAPQPPGPEITAPTYMIAAGQQPGYPPSLPASGVVPSQQQCNVAVHYNANQGTVQTQSANAASQNGSEAPAGAVTGDDSNLGCFRIFCGTVIMTVVLTIVVVVLTG